MKRKYLIASHGKFSSGLKNSIAILTGQAENIETIDAYIDDSDFSDIIEVFIKKIDINEQGIIFTDLFGGSVNQKITRLLLAESKKNIVLISNANLAIILTILFLTPDSKLTNEIIDNAISESNVTRVEIQSIVNDDEEDFLS
ncbi:hypothetical protein HMPREF9318_01458 [Streptococcus urinalis FB127-CNA-2]|uniref:PTS system fructose IIA component n=1 Tax=Streptococcus urinalis 2285-97 TaxID=764291 RepID=G5KDJ5_9STRE|nr:PTS mannose transporter subunit IIA [Streptococcus urinalis]EHJ57323.1 PTS system fructose IIA component [Streptococcus urinalis 2285-97]EKS19382.1 hypothetical protein HMPREF9318_01458 [Streptococcus urinalis FB127-CNA-2]VEF31513.1 PTS system mannose-specific transporter subunit IIA [Streptococcus urinalis]